ncbi:MAG: hypothetical protein VW547_02570 [Alphaproteobacteria bacterium]
MRAITLDQANSNIERACTRSAERGLKPPIDLGFDRGGQANAFRKQEGKAAVGVIGDTSAMGGECAVAGIRARRFPVEKNRFQAE